MTKQTSKQIVIIGAGVIGLTSGIRLLEQGASVTIMANALSPNTTSDVAAAYWFPTGEPEKRVLGWGRVAYDVLNNLSNDPETGVFFRYFNKLSHDPLPDPPYLDIVDEFERLDCSTLRGNYSDGFRMRIPLIDTPIYMAYLMRHYHALGGQIEQRYIDNLLDLAEAHPVIINCSGAWAAQLANDSACYPMRGQVVRIRKPEGLTPDLFSMTWRGEPTYIIPRQHDCILGGTKQVNNWTLSPEQATADAIIARCAEFNPLLSDPEILEHKVGLRPGRSRVRLESEALSTRCTIIHNYGHGEDGHGMAWGCAAEVADIVSQLV
ncbi:MAG: FAD-dependent oxidoreductase [Candidatus Promineifilaceae bacterium]